MSERKTTIMTPMPTYGDKKQTRPDARRRTANLPAPPAPCNWSVISFHLSPPSMLLGARADTDGGCTCGAPLPPTTLKGRLAWPRLLSGLTGGAPQQLPRTLKPSQRGTADNADTTEPCEALWPSGSEGGRQDLPQSSA